MVRLEKSPDRTVDLVRTLSSHTIADMWGVLLFTKKGLAVGAISTGAAAYLAQAVVGTSPASEAREITVFLLGALSFVGSVIASTFISGRMLGKMETEQRGMNDQIKVLDKKAQEWVDRNTLAMLDRLLSEKIADLKTSLGLVASERDHQYNQIIQELARLRASRE